MQESQGPTFAATQNYNWNDEGTVQFFRQFYPELLAENSFGPDHDGEPGSSATETSQPHPYEGYLAISDHDMQGSSSGAIAVTGSDSSHRLYSDPSSLYGGNSNNLASGSHAHGGGNNIAHHRADDDDFENAGCESSTRVRTTAAEREAQRRREAEEVIKAAMWERSVASNILQRENWQEFLYRDGQHDIDIVSSRAAAARALRMIEDAEKRIEEASTILYADESE